MQLIEYAYTKGEDDTVSGKAHIVWNTEKAIEVIDFRHLSEEEIKLYKSAFLEFENKTKEIRKKSYRKFLTEKLEIKSTEKVIEE